MVINVNDEYLENTNKTVAGRLTELDEKISRIDAIVEKMGSVWQDKTYEYFKEGTNSYIEKLKTYKEQLSSYNKYIEGYVNVLHVLDSSYGSKKINNK